MTTYERVGAHEMAANVQVGLIALDVEGHIALEDIRQTGASVVVTLKNGDTFVVVVQKASNGS